MKKLFVAGLSPTTTEESLQALFAPFGTVRSLKLVKDLFSGKCKGLGFIEMEGHEARASIEALDGKTIDGHTLKVKYEEKRGKGPRRGRR